MYCVLIEPASLTIIGGIFDRLLISLEVCGGGCSHELNHSTITGTVLDPQSSLIQKISPAVSSFCNPRFQINGDNTSTSGK
jgi:hypothetical protein